MSIDLYDLHFLWRYQDEGTRWSVPVPEKRPHACPICGGCGTVAPGFYSPSGSTPANRETCRACFGRGVVWES